MSGRSIYCLWSHNIYLSIFQISILLQIEIWPDWVLPILTKIHSNIIWFFCGKNTGLSCLESIFFGLHWNCYHCQVEQLSLFADRCRLNKENWSKFSKMCRTMYIHHKQASNPYSLTLELFFWMWTFIPHWLMKTLIYADKHIIISYIQSHKSRITKYLHFD